MAAFWDEVRAVSGKGWALLGGAVPTVIGLILSAAKVIPVSAYWFIPLLLGVIVAEALVIAERRRERDAARASLDSLLSSVRDCLALDQIQVRFERIQNGPPSVPQNRNAARFPQHGGSSNQVEIRVDAR